MFETLSNNDLTHTYREMDRIYKNNNLLSQGLSNQTRLIKMISISIFHDSNTLEAYGRKNIFKLSKLIDSTNKNREEITMSKQVTIFDLIMEELSEDILSLINAINDGKHEITHPQLVTPNIVLPEIKKLEV